MSAPTSLYALAVDAIVELFEVDATAQGETSVFHFTPADNYGMPVIWKGVSYAPFPIQASGFEWRGSGTLPTPTLAVSNVFSLMGAAARAHQDYIGARVTRIRTMKKYLDAANFPNGNPSANPNMEFPREVWFVNRRSGETKDLIQFELAAAWDVQGVQIPRRVVIQNLCPWRYRGPECTYAGPPVADIYDNPTTDPAKDDCAKHIKSCQYRFGNGDLPYGAFPGIGLMR
ncbi:phage minor tail protein L [Cupriavidus taiwanensis]|uniref:phage minor tail protein L n=1 Tax=Cupriavidus taiwanensis TaxID=164546 RepID=UPI000E1934AA|nr:phage minor tail protein L [Cupriavidus taiwanensis]SPA17261.1 Phage minor tail protein L [Cupriavidus taiwanensis]